MPAIEIVGTWWDPWTAIGAGNLVADNAAFDRWIVGPETVDWSGIDLLDLPVESGLARERAKDRYARMGEDFHRTVRDAFLDIAKREPGRCVVIDATQPIEAVSGAIARAVQQRLL